MPLQDDFFIFLLNLEDHQEYKLPIDPTDSLQEILKDAFSELFQKSKEEVMLLIWVNTNSNTRTIISLGFQDAMELGINSGDMVQFISTQALKTKFLQEGGIESIILELQMDTQTVLQAPRNQRVQRTFELAYQNACLVDLIILAFFRWPNDPKIFHLIKEVFILGEVYEIAPKATAYLTETRKELLDVLQSKFTVNSLEKASNSLPLSIAQVLNCDIHSRIALHYSSKEKVNQLLDLIDFPVGERPFFDRVDNFKQYWYLILSNLEEKNNISSLLNEVKKQLNDQVQNSKHTLELLDAVATDKDIPN